MKDSPLSHHASVTFKRTEIEVPWFFFYLKMSCLQLSITSIDYKRKDPVFWIETKVKTVNTVQIETLLRLV